MPGSVLYLDSSAILKLAVPERETEALRRTLHAWNESAASVIARVEVTRAAWRAGPGAGRRAEAVLERIALVGLDDEVVREAAHLEPLELRAVDAIHLATALSLGDDLGALCAYDTRLTQAARSLGIEVLAPA